MSSTKPGKATSPAAAAAPAAAAPSALSQEEQRVRAIVKQGQAARAAVTLLRAPVTTLRLFAAVVLVEAASVLRWARRHSLLVSVLIAAVAVAVGLRLTDGPHSAAVAAGERQAMRAAWWVVLGFLSSCGLGSGLHTFVLYLGPHIARVALAATECRSLRIDAAEMAAGATLTCPPDVSSAEAAGVTILGIASLVLFDAFLWGVGTALGELPPYFVARAARHADDRLRAMQGDDDDDSAGGGGGGLAALLAWGKATMLAILERFGFFGILLFASIPNPLFDLAGLTCGASGMPFWSFFGATLIGKAVVKASIQTFSVILVFSHALEGVLASLDAVGQYWPWLATTIRAAIESERHKYHSQASAAQAAGAAAEGLSIGKALWNGFLALMIASFVLSIVQSSVQGLLLQRDEANARARVRAEMAIAKSKQPKSQ